MACCGQNPLMFSTLSTAYQNSSLSQIRNQSQSLLQESQTAMGTTLYFSEQGHLIERPPKGQTYGFKIAANDLLKELTITRKNTDSLFWKSISQEKHELEKDDTLRLGTTCISVFEIYPMEEHNVSKQPQKVVKTQKQHCRICFIAEQSKEDPLINFCKCSGTVKFMHLECYREWFIQQIRIYKEHRITYFQFHNIRCDLCKESIPFSVTKNGRVYPILNYRKEYQAALPENSLFQNLSDEELDMLQLPLALSDSQNSGSFIEIPEERERSQNDMLIRAAEPNASEIKTGRCLVMKSQKINEQGERTIEVILVKLKEKDPILFGSDIARCHILMGNGSASPVHSRIVLENNKIYIEDMQSTTGTFLQLKEHKSVTFDSKQGLLLQHSNKELICFRGKRFFIPLFTMSNEYRVMLQADKKSRK